MPFAANQGVCIYYAVEGNGPPLVLQHGIAMSQEFWRQYDYVDQLKGDYQLVLIDARGHGASDKPYDPEVYRPELMAGDVLAVLDDLGVATAHYYGYSLGAAIGFEIARRAPARLRSLILGGMSPYVNEVEKRYGERVRQLLRMGLQVFVEMLEETSGAMTPEARSLIFDNDLRALRAVTDAFNGWPGAKDVLPTIAVPSLVYAGEADFYRSGARECAKHMSNATFVSLPNQSHAMAFTRCDLVLPHVKKFLTAVDQGER